MSSTARDVAAGVVKRDGELSARQKAERDVDLRVNGARDWFATVVPRHVDPDAFIALALGYCKRDPKLLQAAFLNPDGLMLALVEPARLGLTLGEEYHLTHFKNNATGIDDVTGMRDYKGEIQLILRSGQVSGVFLYVVRRGGPKPDRFRWAPGMELPQHEIADDGLATDAERGVLYGAWGFCTLRGGGQTAPVVMMRDEIAKHRAAAKTMKWWGPEWPGELPWTPDMWKKTIAHKLYDVVPHSADHQAEMLRATVAYDTVGRQMLRLPEGSPLPEITEYASLPEQQAISNGEPPAQPDGKPANGNGGADPGQGRTEAQARRDRMAAIRDMFKSVGLGSPKPGDTRIRTVLAGVLAAGDGELPLVLGSVAELTNDQVLRVWRSFRSVILTCERDKKDVGPVLREIAANAEAQMERTAANA